jgi:hypothetical protein
MTEHMKACQELRRRLLAREDISEPDALASAAERAFKLERRRAGKPYRDLLKEDLDRLVKLALAEKEELAAVRTKKAAAGGAYGMF